LHQVNEKAQPFCPKKPYDELIFLEDQEIINQIVAILASANQTFIRDSDEQVTKLCGDNGEELGLEDGGKDFMIGRLVALATKRCDLYKKMKGNEYAKIFETEKRVSIPSIHRQSVMNKQSVRTVYMNAKLQFVIGLGEHDTGFNPKMTSLITQIVAVKGSQKQYQGLLTLPMANKYLWGQGTQRSLFHKCIVSAIPQFDLGFYQQGSPHTSWRIGKIVTESSPGGGAAEFGNDEDQYFEKATKRSDDDGPEDAGEPGEELEPASMAAFK
jgi:hypothetical protein